MARIESGSENDGDNNDTTIKIPDREKFTQSIAEMASRVPRLFAFFNSSEHSKDIS